MTRSQPKRPPVPRSTAAWLAVGRAYNLCDAVLSARLAKVGLRVIDHELLIVLANHPGATQQELAARCFIAKSGVSMLLSQMERQDWVVRRADPRDARAKCLYLTETGEGLARQASRIQAEVAEAMAVGTSATELDTVADVMARVSERLEGLLGEG